MFDYIILLMIIVSVMFLTETDHTTDDTTRDYDYFDDQCCNEISVIGDKSTVTKNSPGSCVILLFNSFSIK